MKKFELFLEKVKDANQDEFGELQDILSRYNQLSNKNTELHNTQENFTVDLDKKSKELTSYIKDMDSEKMTINNRMSLQQQELESIDSEKSKLLAQRDENTKQKSQKTTETGKMLMTIENLHKKCEQKSADMITSTKDFKAHEKIKNFDNTTESGKKAIEQVKIIIQVLKNFKELKEKLLEDKSVRDKLEGFKLGEEIK